MRAANRNASRSAVRVSTSIVVVGVDSPTYFSNAQNVANASRPSASIVAVRVSLSRMRRTSSQSLASSAVLSWAVTSGDSWSMSVSRAIVVCRANSSESLMLIVIAVLTWSSAMPSRV